ncbi:hypothetical protein [Povalibacter uvarum]|uniref:hypothetical protein n=1 Tax=Povalibacter uvarum TaxID=732238 RepID=UPI00162067C2|nr:hypothetical protein [Povalibacter uvarum]
MTDTLNGDPRAQAIRAAERRAEERAQLLQRQSSPSSPPEDRIALWERLHMLVLPRSASHPLLALIAQQTSLTLDQIRDEQQRRARGAMEQL